MCVASAGAALSFIMNLRCEPLLPLPELQVILGPEGVAPIGGEGGGGVLGRGGIDRVLVIAPGQEPLLSAGDMGRAGRGGGEAQASSGAQLFVPSKALLLCAMTVQPRCMPLPLHEQAQPRWRGLPAAPICPSPLSCLAWRCLW